jgi:hypothetical protein
MVKGLASQQPEDAINGLEHLTKTNFQGGVTNAHQKKLWRSAPLFSDLRFPQARLKPPGNSSRSVPVA